MFDYASEDCKIYFLIIPHASQVNDHYKQVSEQVGAVFSNEFVTGNTMYPLVMEIMEFFSGDSRVRVLDTVKDLAEAEISGSPVYFNNDSHLNAHGQLLVGQFLVEQLKGLE